MNIKSAREAAVAERCRVGDLMAVARHEIVPTRKQHQIVRRTQNL